MTGTSRALRRLGVAGLSAVLMTTGLAAFTAVAANAANVNAGATSVSVTPPGDSATVGTCNPFTATVSPTPAAADNYTVTVVLSQQAPTTQSTKIGFCNTTNFTPASSYPNPQNQPTGTQQTPPPAICPAGGQTGGPSVPLATPTTVTCQGNFSTQNGSGQVTFGIISDTAGSETVQVYVDNNRNGVFDSGIDKTTTVTKTWNANTAGSIACTPTTQSKAASPAATTTFTCTVTTGAAGAGTPATGQDVKFHVTAGPDADAPAALGHACNDTPDPNNQANKGDTYTCTVTNNGVTGTDDLTAWVDQDGNGGIGSTEPTAAPVHVVWVSPAPNGSTVAVTCDKNVTATTTSAGGNVSSVCQDPLTDKSVKFTATVKSGVNSTNPVVGTLVSWTITGNNGAGVGDPATDTETLDSSSCTTDSSGSCSVNLTNGVPTEGEVISVQASVGLASGGTSVANGTKQWHDPFEEEARNVTVAPASATQIPGGAQTLVGTATDRFTNPVAGVCIGWRETGPGRFTNAQQTPSCFAEDNAGNTSQFDTTCVTGSNGQCSVEVTSLTTESGAETVTASIENTFTENSGNPAPGFSRSYECQSPAGFSYFSDPVGNPGNFHPDVPTTPNANGANNPATGAPAGNCTAAGTVNWSQSTPPPPPAKRKVVGVHLTCFSNHKHSVTCNAQLSKPISGVTVVLHNGKGAVVGTDTTNGSGKAVFHLHHLKSHKKHHYRAHAKQSSKTHPADSNTVGVRVK